MYPLPFCEILKGVKLKNDTLKESLFSSDTCQSQASLSEYSSENIMLSKGPEESFQWIGAECEDKSQASKMKEIQ